MNECLVCRVRFRSLTMFARHMTRQHGVDHEALWRRIEQTNGDPLTAQRTERGRWVLFVQGRLNL